MNRIFLLVIAICLTGTAIGQDATNLKRAPYMLKIPVNKKTVYQEALGESLFVLSDNTIQLYAGETVNIEVEQTDGVITSLRAVTAVKDPAKTIVLAFTQSVNKKKHEMMMLSVKNPFPWPLTYTASIFLLHQLKWVNTSVVPVMAGLMSFETWPDPIITIRMGKLAFKK